MTGDDNVASAMTPESGRQPATRALGRWADSEWVSLHRLKMASVLLPVVFMVALELVRSLVPGVGISWDGYHLSFVAVTVLSITAFGLVMFQFIELAQRQVLRQNRGLAAMNAVSSAVQGELGVERIIDVVLESVLASSGADEVSVTVFDPQDPPLDADNRTYRRVTESGSTSEGLDQLRSPAAGLVEFPLSTGTRVVGRMRLFLPADARECDCLDSDTLQNIAHQLASAVQLAQFFADLERRRHEGHAFHHVLMQISNQSALADILASVVRHGRDLLGSDEAAICLNEGASRSLRLEGATLSGYGTTSLPAEADQVRNVHQNHLVCPTRSAPQWETSLAVPLRGPVGALGDLWIARRSDLPFTARDQAFLSALAGLATIALTSAESREDGRQGAVLAERERIAREMHDSLAQVLGVTHLRLRALDSREEISRTREIATELAELADICEEAYHDVREAILGLRESSRTERGLVDSLRAYLAKYSRQCGIESSLDSDLDHELALSPRSEVQVIRVIQEALTNVRKHSGARSTTVRIGETDSATTFVVEDDGHGFDPAGALVERDGFGLFAMRERMELLNGSLTIDSAPGRGTRVVACVPERSHPRPAPV